MSNRANAKKFRDNLRQRTTDALRKQSKQMLAGVAAETKDDAAINTPVDTGELQEGWDTEASDNGLTQTIFNDTPYANEREFAPGGGMLRMATLPGVMEERGKRHWNK
jgi:hypothetical protein